MTRTRLLSVSLLVLHAACGLERLEAAYAEHGVTYNSTDVPGSDTTVADTTGTGADTDSSSTTGTSTSGAEAGHEATSDPGTTTTTASDTSTGGATDAPPAVCGDGQQDPGEECDDGNDDPMDGCKQCAGDRFLFASSVEYQGGELDGLYGADQRCRMLAAIAGLPNFGTYRAWLSDSKLSAADRLVHHRGRYLLVNGLVVAMDWDDLTDGTLEHPINVTEKSQTSDGYVVWTGTLASGQPAFGSSFCHDWTKASGWSSEFGGSGIRTQTDALWSYLDQDGCGSIAVIYCIEQ